MNVIIQTAMLFLLVGCVLSDASQNITKSTTAVQIDPANETNEQSSMMKPSSQAGVNLTPSPPTNGTNTGSPSMGTQQGPGKPPSLKAPTPSPIPGPSPSSPTGPESQMPTSTPSVNPALSSTSQASQANPVPTQAPQPSGFTSTHIAQKDQTSGTHTAAIIQPNRSLQVDPVNKTNTSNSSPLQAIHPSFSNTPVPNPAPRPAPNPPPPQQPSQQEMDIKFQAQSESAPPPSRPPPQANRDILKTDSHPDTPQPTAGPTSPTSTNSPLTLAANQVDGLNWASNGDKNSVGLGYIIIMTLLYVFQ